MNFGEVRAKDGRGDELGNPLSAPDLEGLVAEIGEDDLHFAAIVAVDRSRGVEAGDPMLQREPRTGSHLELVTVRDLNGKAGCDGASLSGLQREIFSRDDVKPGGMLRRIFGQRQAFAVGQAR